MSKKVRTAYVCNACGQDHAKWQGQCSSCGEWNTLSEVRLESNSVAASRSLPGTQQATPQLLSSLEGQEVSRLRLPGKELNRVLGGGIPAGALVLIGGEPGIGKSTLLLQTALRMLGSRVLYVSGEESSQQVKLRADRLPGDNPDLYLLPETDVEAILTACQQLHPALVIVDSIQTLYSGALESAPGTVGQVRECATRLLRYAKETGVPVLLVGHITKEGSLAGPKVLEHMVDAVIEFEGERHYQYRVIRSVKNRFGPTPELGFYEMQHTGLKEVANPSALFLSSSESAAAGVAVAATLQGQRPLLVECQALVADAAYGTPQRSANGIDMRRLSLLLAVLEKKCNLRMGSKDVFVNLAGGLRLDDPGMDLAIVAALLSAYFDTPLPPHALFVAELSLTGALRLPVRLEHRLTEGQRMGFIRGFGAQASGQALPEGLTYHGLAHVAELLPTLFG
ncbi:MAG: DNA repair protein RadA [Bacteroidetes bacterium]|nr:DNA repair protein RadA [Bacteroidota bacterium]